VGYVVVDVDPVRSGDEAIAVAARPIYSSEDISVYALAAPSEVSVSTGDVVAMVVAWLAASGALGAAAVIGARSWARRGRRTLRTR
jgi:hypothetical protein